ncbi:MAG: hypothetical protein E5299_01151 [Burkholderia gladioli]|nr:MAG: hypothetical protein E5299_01151 [Burkholderia gladioli]
MTNRKQRDALIVGLVSTSPKGHPGRWGAGSASPWYAETRLIDDEAPALILATLVELVDVAGFDYLVLTTGRQRPSAR